MRRIVFLGAATVLTGCALVVGFGDRPDGVDPSAAQDDAGADTSTVGDAPNTGVDGVAPPNDAAPDARLPTDCSVYYVANSGGLDTNDGCAPNRPFSTVGAALVAAKNAAVLGRSIWVCKGTYNELALEMGFPVNLLGGYNCNDWSRENSEKVTVIHGTGPTQNASLVVNPRQTAAIGRDVVIERFTFVGPENNGASIGLQIVGASPTVRGNAINGANAGTVRSIGLRIQDSNAEITDNTISVVGTVTLSGAVGLSLITENAAPDGAWRPSIHDNVISGGSAIASQAQNHGTIGAEILPNHALDMTGVNAFARNEISAGSGGSTVPNQFQSIGLMINGNAKVDVIESEIRGGTGTSAGIRLGVYDVSSNTVRYLRNKILGADVSSAAGSSITGIDINAPGSTVASRELVGNMIHAGHIAAPDAKVISLRIRSADSFKIYNNTFLLPEAPSYGTHIYVEPAKDAVIDVQNNIFASVWSTAGQVRRVFQTENCSNQARQQLAPIHANLFMSPTVFFGVGADVTATTACPNFVQPTTFNDFVLAEQAIVVSALDNIEMGPTCDPANAPSCALNCLSSIAQNSCVSRVFTSNNAAFNARSTFGLGGAFQIYPGATGSCLYAKGGHTLTGEATHDYKNVLRTNPFSIGAWELETCLQKDGGS